MIVSTGSRTVPAYVFPRVNFLHEITLIIKY